jgi:SAM-dependent methyltransferase
LPPVPRFPTPDDASRDKKRDEPVDGEGAHAVADEGHPAPEEAVARPSTDDIEPAPIDDTLPTYGKARATPEPHRIEAQPDHEDAGEPEPAPSPVTGEETPEPADTRTVQPATGADEEPPDASSDRATDADAPARPSPIPAPAADGSGVVIVGRIHVIGTGGPSLSPEARVRRGAAAEAMVREPEVADVAARVQVDEDAEELDLSEAEEIRDSHDSIEIETEVAESAAPPSEAEIGSIPPPPPPGKASKPAPAPAPAAASAPAARPTPPPPEKPGRTTASRRRHKPWWDEMFNDDYLRSLPAYSARFTQKEVDFIESALGVKSNGMILDLACGNGRHAVELSNRGYQIVGLDLSLAMLARAAELAQKNNQKINFIHGDMREMAFESTFDGAIFLGTSFGYFDDDTNVKVIEGLWRALKTKGTVIIETANRDYLISRQPNMVWFEGDGCVCMEESSFNYITSRLIVKRSLLFDDGRQLEHEFSIRVYCLHEIGKVLHNAGFRVAEVSGHIHTPSAFFGPESTNLIILAEKRESKKS